MVPKIRKANAMGNITNTGDSLSFTMKLVSTPYKKSNVRTIERGCSSQGSASSLHTCLLFINSAL